MDNPFLKAYRGPSIIYNLSFLGTLFVLLIYLRISNTFTEIEILIHFNMKISDLSKNYEGPNFFPYLINFFGTN